MPKIDPIRLRDVRINEDTIIEMRAHRTSNLTAWKNRINVVDRLYRGEWDTVFPDETTERAVPFVMNMVQVGMEDISRLTSEINATVRTFPDADTEEAERNAQLRQMIAETHWEYSKGDLLIPRLAMDLVGTGACFLVVSVADEYPCLHRIDPRMAYPDVHDGKLYDLLVSQVLKLRQAARLFPMLGLEADPMRPDAVEVIEYYGPDECVQAVVPTINGKPTRVEIVKRWNPGIERAPVAFVQLDSFDGEFRGLFDQVAGSLNTKNRIVRLILDHADQLVYAPMVSKGLLNPEERPGPLAHYRLDPNVQDAQMGRLSPASSSVDVWRLLEFLEREERAGVAYPAQRHGEVGQSIASAAFVSSTQGHLTTVVRTVQRLLASLRRDAHRLMFELEEKHLDTEKPLLRPIGRKKTYLPSRDVKGRYYVQVSYGAGSGLDRLNADARVMQHMSVGLISKETAREQIDYLSTGQEEQSRINREITESALVQKFLAEAPWDVIAKVLALVEKGRSFADAIDEVLAEQQAQQEAAQAGQVPPEGAVPPEMAQGGGPAPTIPPPPLARVLVGA